MATIESGTRFGIPLVFLVSTGFIATCVLVIFVRRISFDFMRGRKGGGARYFVIIEQKDGTTTMFFMGKSKTNDALLEQFPQAVKRYPIKVSLN